MKELLRTNDLVLISFIEALLRDSKIDFLVLDQHMSVLEGSIGILPRRVMVTDEALLQARRIMRDAGLGKNLAAENSIG